ncbi:hypothetical protein ASG49_05940 [Marmoricola sp. Leaf446]|uniref:glycosyltransferase family 2 protein n=1 Tax=Marmoricola sp. Leaf446 TaxID=1736379 RepID=UPI0006F520DF|nr:glycosyltransferase family 2 protein [Marmoricola sp. Leaf446]KQT94418.1 hypothetical protein ASG49_05940 [Marmoricola sp. Leaf446]
MIDVVLPYRGDAGLMRAAVTSVLDQTHDDWRLHVVDDADPDPSVHAWLHDHEDPRVSVWRSPRRLGVNAVFRHCAALGQAPFVTFMGCDDLMRPDHLAHLLTMVEACPQASMYQPGVEVIDAQGATHAGLADRVKMLLRPAGGPRYLGGEELARSLMTGNWLYFPSMLWRREAAALSFRPGLETALDLELVMRLVLSGHQLVVDDHVTFSYRRHAASASSSTARTAARFAEESQISQEVARSCAELGWRRARRAALVRPTSRAHALANVAAALRRGDRAGLPVSVRAATSWR